MITSFNPGCQTQKCPECSPGVVYVVSKGDNDVLHYVISAIGGPPTALVIKTNKPKGRSQLNIDCKKMASKNDTKRKDSITKPEGVKVLYSFGVVFSRASITRFFSSPELKAQVSFSDHLSSVVCLSVCLSVHLSVRPSVNFSHFHLLLQNHWANFNQTWHKASLGEGDSSLFK